jgi:hypothetical protein
MDKAYIVICRADRAEGEPPGSYQLATRTVFESEDAAILYAATIAANREPLVVDGDFGSFGSERSEVPRGTGEGEAASDVKTPTEGVFCVWLTVSPCRDGCGA